MFNQNPYAPPAPVAQPKAALRASVKKPTATTANGTPVGTSAEVLAWVDGDPARAALALADEQATGDPRVTLVAKLEAIIAAAPADGGSPVEQATALLAEQGIS